MPAARAVARPITRVHNPAPRLPAKVKGPQESQAQVIQAQQAQYQGAGLSLASGSPFFTTSFISTPAGQLSVNVRVSNGTVLPVSINKNVIFTQPVNISNGPLTVTGSQTYTYAIQAGKIVPTLTTQSGTVAYNGTPIANVGNKGAVTIIPGATIAEPEYGQVSGNNQFLGSIVLAPTYSNGAFSFNYASFQPATVNITGSVVVVNPVTGSQNEVGYQFPGQTSYNPSTGIINITPQGLYGPGTSPLGPANLYLTPQQYGTKNGTGAGGGTYNISLTTSVNNQGALTFTTKENIISTTSPVTVPTVQISPSAFNFAGQPTGLSYSTPYATGSNLSSGFNLLSSGFNLLPTGNVNNIDKSLVSNPIFQGQGTPQAVAQNLVLLSEGQGTLGTISVTTGSVTSLSSYVNGIATYKTTTSYNNYQGNIFGFQIPTASTSVSSSSGYIPTSFGASNYATVQNILGNNPTTLTGQAIKLGTGALAAQGTVGEYLVSPQSTITQKGQALATILITAAPIPFGGAIGKAIGKGITSSVISNAFVGGASSTLFSTGYSTLTGQPITARGLLTSAAFGTAAGIGFGVFQGINIGIRGERITTPSGATATGISGKLLEGEQALVYVVKENGKISLSIGTPAFKDISSIEVSSEQANLNNVNFVTTPTARAIVLKTIQNNIPESKLGTYLGYGYKITAGLKGVHVQLQTSELALESLTESQNKALTDYISSKGSQVQIFGTTSVKLALGSAFRNPHDIDIQLSTTSPDVAAKFAQGAAKLLGKGFSVEPGTNLVVNQAGEHILDIHFQGEENYGIPQVSSTPLGFKLGNPITSAKGFSVSPVGDTLVGKANSALTVRAGQLVTEITAASYRAKDLPDFIAIGKALNTIVNGKYSGLLSRFSDIAIAKGYTTQEAIEASENLPITYEIKLQPSSSSLSAVFKSSFGSASSLVASSIVASSIVASPIISASPSKSTSPSKSSSISSFLSSISSSASTSPSRSISPSSSVSSSISPSTSKSPSSSISPSKSPSISISPSISSSPSISISPSVSSSPSISPSTSPSVSYIAKPSAFPSVFPSYFGSKKPRRGIVTKATSIFPSSKFEYIPDITHLVYRSYEKNKARKLKLGKIAYSRPL